MDIENTVLDILEEVCSTDEVKIDKDLNLFDTDLLDSLTTMELLTSIEENIGVEISPSDVLEVDIETPNKIIELVQKKFSEKFTIKHDEEIFLPLREKNHSILIQKEILQNRNILSVYGSSEFTSERDEFFPTSFFNNMKEKNFLLVLQVQDIIKVLSML